MDAALMDVSSEIRARLTMRPEAKALEIDGVWRTWGEVNEVVGRIDAVLDETGIGESMPVGVIGRNRLTHMAAILALLGRRRSVVFIHSLLPPAGLAAEIEKLKLPAVIADRDDWASPQVIEAARKVGTLGISLSDRDAEIRLVPGLEKRGPGPHRATTPDVAVELLTSGTTGLPKRVPIPWRTVDMAMRDAKAVLDQNFRAAARPDSAPMIRIHYVPLGNMSGVWTLLTSVLDGSPLVVFDKFDLPRWVKTLERYRPHYIGLVPAAVKMVYDAGVPQDVLASVTVVNMGGARLDPEVQKRFEEKYQVLILSSYGATEFFGAVASWSLEDRRRYGNSKFGSTGRVRPGVNLRVIDTETGEPLPSGAVGLLEVQVERVGPEWTRTTDLASLDDEGFLFIHGRIDGAISRGGFKMLPQEIVEILCRHPHIADAAVVGVPDSRLGEVPMAAVELIPGSPRVTPAELEAFAREHLVPYKVPVRFTIVDKLPRTLSLKVSVVDVRAMFAA
jgi:acyl-CoA synthetase (AMP-forming)/AMP-acid ligase II